MRRRDSAAEAARAAGGQPPEYLLTMAGVARFRGQADAEPLPDWMQPTEVEWWRRATALTLWMKARRDWCADNGRDFAATFYPRWLERRR